MIEKSNFNILNYVKKEEYTGSMDGMRYMVKKVDDEAEVTIWPEPFAYAYTDEEMKIRKRFPLTSDGMMEICDYLNNQYEEQRPLWELSKTRK